MDVGAITNVRYLPNTVTLITTVYPSGLPFLIFHEQRRSIHFSLFRWHVIELFYPFKKLFSNGSIIDHRELFYFIKDSVQVVNAGLLTINQNPLRRDLVRRNSPADRAIVSILVIPIHFFSLLDHGQ